MKEKDESLDLKCGDELLREADEIEKEIAHIRLDENPIDKERLRGEILLELLRREERKYKKIERARKRKLYLRTAACVAVAFVGIFGLSMTSQANRVYLVEKVEEIFGDRTGVTVESKEIETVDFKEDKARDEIERTLEVAVPEFYYMPASVELLRVNIHKEIGVAEMIYGYGGKRVTFKILKNDEKTAETGVVDGIQAGTVEVEQGGGTIDLWELANQVNEEKFYYAQWMERNTYYSLEGDMNLEEMEKILKKMRY